MPNPRPLVQPATHRIIDSEYKLELGSYADMKNEKYLKEVPDLAYKEYKVKTPFIGEYLRYLGLEQEAKWHPSIKFILESVLNGEYEENKEEIKRLIGTSGEIQTSIFNYLYFELKRRNPDPKLIESTFSKLKPILSEFVTFGAAVLDTMEYDFKEVFYLLINHGLDGKALSEGLVARIYTGDEQYGFTRFKEIMNLCIRKGADINVFLNRNPKFGTFLHYYIAMEYTFADKLLEFYDSISSIPRTIKPNYEIRDGFGNTPLLIAIYTRNHRAIYGLIKLAQEKNVKIGINIPDIHGCTPLQLLAAIGMPVAFEDLLSLGANTSAKDHAGNNLDYYLNLPIAEVEKLVAPYLNPKRCDVTGKQVHSQLYFDDAGNSAPACLFMDGIERFGDEQEEHFVILSPEEPHISRLAKVAEVLKERAAEGDLWAQGQLPTVIDQLDFVKFYGKYNTLLLEIYEKEDQISKNLHKYISSLPDILHEKRIELAKKYLSKLAPGSNPRKAEILRAIENATTETVSKACERCKAFLLDMLPTADTTKAFLISKEKYLRRACALGQIEEVRKLLGEGANPNNQDDLKRSALHYAVMRRELVEKEVKLSYEEQGLEVPADINAQVEAAMRAHPAVIDALASKDLNYDIPNKTGNKVVDILNRDAKSDDLLTQEIALACLRKIPKLDDKKVPEKDDLGSTVTYKIS